MALVGAMVSACRPGSSTPEDAFDAFVGDVRAHKASAAWAGLSAASQEALLADARKLGEALGQPPETDPERLLFDRAELLLLRKPESRSVSSRPGDVVVLRVAVEGGASANVRMVREGAAWKVDLVGSLDARPAPSAPPAASVTPAGQPTGTATRADTAPR